VQTTYFRIDSPEEIIKILNEFNSNISKEIDCSFIMIAQDYETIVAYTEVINCSSRFSLMKSFKIRNDYQNVGIEHKLLNYLVWELQQDNISFLSIPNVMSNPDLKWIKDFKIDTSGFIIAVM